MGRPGAVPQVAHGCRGTLRHRANRRSVLWGESAGSCVRLDRTLREVGAILPAQLQLPRCDLMCAGGQHKVAVGAVEEHLQVPGLGCIRRDGGRPIPWLLRRNCPPPSLTVMPPPTPCIQGTI